MQNFSIWIRPGSNWIRTSPSWLRISSSRINAVDASQVSPNSIPQCGRTASLDLSFEVLLSEIGQRLFESCAALGCLVLETRVFVR